MKKSNEEKGGPPREEDVLEPALGAQEDPKRDRRKKMRRQAEQALRDSEDRYRAVAERTPQPLAVHDGEKILYMNPAGIKMLGTGKPLPGARDAGLAELVKGSLKGHGSMGEATDPVEIECHNVDGDAIDVELRGAPIVFDGVPARLIAMRDVTQSKKDKAELVQQARRAEALLGLGAAAETMGETDFLRYGIGVGERLTGSQIGMAIFVGEDQEVVKRVLWSREADRNRCGAIQGQGCPYGAACVWAGALRQKAPVLANHVDGASGEPCLPEGSSRLIRMVSVPIIEGGLVRMVIGLGNKPKPYIDFDMETARLVGQGLYHIVAKRRADDARRDIQESLNEAQRIAGVGSYVFDAQADHWSSSEELGHLFGLVENSERSLRGWLSLVHPEDRSMMEDYFQSLIAGRVDSFDMQYRIIRQNDGEERLARGLGRLEFDAQGNFLKMVGTIQDITERELHEEGLRNFRMAMDASADAIFLVDRSSMRFVDVNEAACRMLNRAREELLDLGPCGALDMPRDELARDYDSVIAGGPGTEPVEKMRKNEDGSQAWFELRRRARSSGAGWMIVTTARDITESKKAQEGLRNFRMAMDASADAIFLVDRSSMLFVDVNKAACHMLGLARERLLALGPEGALDLPRDELARVYDSIIAGGHGAKPLERLIQRADGAQAWVELRSRAQRSGEGWMIVTTARDITEKKKAHEALLNSEAKLRTVYESTSDALMLLNEEGFYDCNAAAAKIFGLSEKNDIKNYSPSDLSPEFQPGGGSSVEWARSRVERALRLGSEKFEWAHKRQDTGEIFQAEVVLTAMTLDGERVLQANVRDISERSKMVSELEQSRESYRALSTELEARVDERTAQLSKANVELQGALTNLGVAKDYLVESEKLAALGGMVAGVAHELNTPLGNGLLASTTLAHRVVEFEKNLESGLKRSTLNRFIADVSEAAKILESNLEKSTRLISSFKRISVDQMGDARRSFDLMDAISEMVFTLTPSIRSAGCQVEVDAMEGGCLMDSYPGALGQVVSNLVSNAMIHGLSPEKNGAVKVKVKTRRLEGLGAPWVEVVVSDDGSGISPEHIKHVFEPFFTTKKGQGGSGLGLHIVHNLVVGILGGTIEAASEKGSGSVFTMRVPLVSPMWKSPDQGGEAA